MPERVPVGTTPPPPVGLKFLLAAAAVAFAAGLGGVALGAVSFDQGADTNGPTRQVTVGEESAIIDAAGKVSPAVVSITTTGVPTLFAPQGSKASGSGFVVTADGLVVTNRHVVANAATDPAVVLADGRRFKGRVVAQDPVFDLALIKLSKQDLPVTELGSVEELRVGQEVIAIGNALGQFDNTVTTGVLSATGRAISADGQSDLENLLQTDAAINPGNSGGPLVNLSGQVIGVNTAVSGGAEGIGFAIPVDAVRQAIDSYQSHGEIRRAQLGIASLTVTPAIAEDQKLPVDAGALIVSVQQGSPAAGARLRAGDIIVAVDEAAVDKKHPLATLIAAHQPGDTVKLTFRRGNKEQTVSVKLGRRG